MIKTHILDKCPHCHGQAMLPVGEGTDHKGRTHIRYAPCPECEGSGNQPRWISFTIANAPVPFVPHQVAAEDGYRRLRILVGCMAILGGGS